MSLYTMGEICEGCGYAILHSCGNCLKECKLGAEDEASAISGSCPKHTSRKYDILDFMYIRGKEYEKVKMTESEFARYYELFKDEMLNNEIDVKFVFKSNAEEGKKHSLVGVRPKDNGNYKLLKPVGFDPTPFARVAYEVENVAYFLIHRY